MILLEQIEERIILSGGVPPRWVRIRIFLDQLEGAFLRQVAKWQRRALAELAPRVEAAARWRDLGYLGQALPLWEEYQQLLDRYLRALVAEGIVHADQELLQGELERLRGHAAPRVRLAGTPPPAKAFQPTRTPVVPEDAVAFFQHRRDLSRFFQAHQLGAVRAVVEQGLAEGWSGREIQKQLLIQVPGLTKARAENIARTESTTAYNQGRLFTYLQDPDFVPAVLFSAILDSRTTPICIARNGLVIALTDPSLRANTPPLHFQCRSVLSPVHKHKLRRLGGPERLAEDAAKWHGAIGDHPPQETKNGVFGSEAWPDVKPLRPAPGVVTPDPRRERERKAAEEVQKREDYRTEVKAAQADVATKKAAGTASEADVRKAGELVRKEAERRGATLKAELQAERDDAIKKTGEAVDRATAVARQAADFRQKVRETDLSYQALEAVAEDADKRLWRHSLPGASSLGHVLTAAEKAELEEKLARAKAAMKVLLTDPELERKRAEAEAEINRQSQREADAYVAQRTVRRKAVVEALGEVRELGGASFRHRAGSQQKGKDAVAKAAELLPKEWIEASNASAVVLQPCARVRRAYYQHYGPNAGKLEVSNSSNPERRLEVALHELGHRFEYTTPGLIGLSQEFLARRTAGESNKRLKDLFPRHGYAAREVVKVDRFLHPYMGKDYGRDATEIVSMGLESVFADTHNLWDQDPDYLEYILGVLSAW